MKNTFAFPLPFRLWPNHAKVLWLFAIAVLLWGLSGVAWSELQPVSNPRETFPVLEERETFNRDTRSYGKVPETKTLGMQECDGIEGQFEKADCYIDLAVGFADPVSCDDPSVIKDFVSPFSRCVSGIIDHYGKYDCRMHTSQETQDYCRYVAATDTTEPTNNCGGIMSASIQKVCESGVRFETGQHNPWKAIPFLIYTLGFVGIVFLKKKFVILFVLFSVGINVLGLMLPFVLSGGDSIVKFGLATILVSLIPLLIGLVGLLSIHAIEKKKKETSTLQ